MRSQGLPYTLEAGTIRNHFTLQLQNKSDRRRVYFVAPGGGELTGYDDLEFIIPQPRVEVDALSDQPVTIFATMPRSSYEASGDFHFTFTDSASGLVDAVKVRFRGP